jgi:hypothetical protein
MEPSKAFAQTETLGRKLVVSECIQLTLYEPGGASSHHYLSADQARELFKSLSLALGKLAVKRALETAR